MFEEIVQDESRESNTEQYPVYCAWCPASAQPIRYAQVEGSHGICLLHAHQLEMQLLERRRRLAA